MFHPVLGDMLVSGSNGKVKSRGRHKDSVKKVLATFALYLLFRFSSYSISLKVKNGAVFLQNLEQFLHTTLGQS